MTVSLVLLAAFGAGLMWLAAYLLRLRKEPDDAHGLELMGGCGLLLLFLPVVVVVVKAFGLKINW